MIEIRLFCFPDDVTQLNCDGFKDNRKLVIWCFDFNKSVEPLLSFLGCFEQKNKARKKDDDDDDAETGWSSVGAQLLLVW